MKSDFILWNYGALLAYQPFYPSYTLLFITLIEIIELQNRTKIVNNFATHTQPDFEVMSVDQLLLLFTS